MSRAFVTATIALVALAAVATRGVAHDGDAHARDAHARDAHARDALESSPAATATTAADSVSCAPAVAFARDTQRMIARVDPDTIDDWRTHRKLVGCRVTAAGATSLSVGEEAKRFYERLRAAGWTRTPDPRDAPHEASLRLRHGATDCVFNINDEARLGTDAEFAVNDSLSTRPGEVRYQLLVLCMPALPADPR